MYDPYFQRRKQPPQGNLSGSDAGRGSTFPAGVPVTPPRLKERPLPAPGPNDRHSCGRRIRGRDTCPSSITLDYRGSWYGFACDQEAGHVGAHGTTRVGPNVMDGKKHRMIVAWSFTVKEEFPA